MQASSLLPVKNGAATEHEKLVPQEQQPEQLVITTTKSQIGSVEYYKGRRIFPSVKAHYPPSSSHTD